MRRLTLTTAVCLLLSAPAAVRSAGCPAPVFSPPQSFAVGAGPFFVAVEDFDGDRTSDLAVANSGSSNVSVLLGTGTGAFQPEREFAAGQRPYGVASGDFNGDEKADLVVANSLSTNLTVLIGTGDGGFQPVVHYPVGKPQFLVTVADLNRDGRDDLALCYAGADGISVLLADGPVSFRKASEFTIPYAQGLCVGDFTGDTVPDLAVASFTARNVSMLRGAGDGTFAPPVSYSVGSPAWPVVAADFNRDGRLDLAVGVAASNVVVLPGGEDGAFGVATHFPVAGGPVALAAADFDGDGITDLAVGQAAENNVAVLAGLGDGGFRPAVHFGAWAIGQSLAVADFNEDGAWDLAVADHLLPSMPSAVSILLNACPPIRPRMSISRSGSDARISWPPGDFRLESTTQLSLTRWTAGGENAVTNNGQIEVTTAVDKPAEFFRLIGSQ